MKAGDQPANPYGIVLDNAGNPWVALFRTNTVVRVNPETMELTPFKEASESSRSRRIEWTSDDMVWYVNEPRGFLGRIDPKTGEVKEYQTRAEPARGRTHSPRMTAAASGSRRPDRSNNWSASIRAQERFFSVNSVSNTIRHIMFDARTGIMSLARTRITLAVPS